MVKPLPSTNQGDFMQVVWFKVSVLEAVLAGFDVVSKEAMRRNISVVNLKASGEKVTVMATNGFSLVESVIDGHEFTEDFEFNFGADSISGIKFLIKEAKKDKKTQVNMSRDAIFNRLFYKSSESEFMLASIDTEFPKVCASLLEVEKQKEHCISFDFEYLKNVIKTIENSQNKAWKGKIKLSFGATDKPIVIEAVNPNNHTKAIVMPVKQ